MARQAKEETFIEYSMEGKEFNYSGRMYPDKAKETKKCTIIPMSLCLNGMITIKGCKLFRSDKNSWIQGPQYESGKEYKDYLYVDKNLNKELDKLVSELEKLLDK